MRRRPKGRVVDGILLLDKPSGIRSNEVLQHVKHLYKARKAGHTGSLDRMASGMLPICFGEATKLSGFLLDASKRYHATFQLGVMTNTGDADGEVRERRQVEDYDAERIESVRQRFLGEIEQVPPMHSALKVNGRRLYELAYQGLEIERQPRPVVIHELKVSRHSRDELLVEVYCSKGTYVRTLAEDIGEALGCGAHVSMLRRVQVGPFDAASAVSLSVVEAACSHHADRSDGSFEAADALLLPLDTAVEGWPRISVRGAMTDFLRKGQAVLVPKSPTGGWVRLYDESLGFFGVGEILDDGRVAPRRLVHPG